MTTEEAPKEISLEEQLDNLLNSYSLDVASGKDPEFCKKMCRLGLITFIKERENLVREEAVEVIKSIPVPHCDCSEISFGKCVICIHEAIIETTKEKAITKINNLTKS